MLFQITRISCSRAPKILAAAALACLALAAPARAGVVLTSAVSGVYTYAFSIPAGDQLFFNTGDRITFTNLVGVTDASVLGPDLAGALTTCGITATTVCFGAPNPLDLDNITAGTILFGTLEIDAPGTTVGSVLFQLDTGGTVANGEVGGPAHQSSTPEPGSLPLVSAGTALLVLVVPRLRRRAAIH